MICLLSMANDQIDYFLSNETIEQKTESPGQSK